MLRKLEKKDAAGMLEWMHDKEIQQNFRTNMLSRDYGDAFSFIENALVKPENGKDIHYAIVDDKDEYLGTISLKNFDLRAGKAEYAICLRRKAQGKGIARTATNQLLKKAFEEFGLERVYLNVLADNEKAIHLYEKCGFRFEGEFRRHLFLDGEYKNLRWYGLLKEEYKEHQKWL